MRTCVTCGPQDADKWKTTGQDPVRYRCIKCTREADKRCYRKDPAKRRANLVRWKENNPEKFTASCKRSRAKNAVQRCQDSKAYVASKRDIVLRHYSQGNPKCACCGVEHLKFLCIDHIEGGGNKHREAIGQGNAIVLWLLKNNLPPGFRVLCFNCNFAVRLGTCPHQRQKPPPNSL